MSGVPTTNGMQSARDRQESDHARRRAAQDRMASAFQRVFGPAKERATAEDKALVVANLEALCCVRTPIMVTGEPDTTSHRIGRHAVWQHINNMRFPQRPPDAGTREPAGGTDGRETDAGPGIAEPTDD